MANEYTGMALGPYASPKKKRMAAEGLDGGVGLTSPVMGPQAGQPTAASVVGSEFKKGGLAGLASFFKNKAIPALVDVTKEKVGGVVDPIIYGENGAAKVAPAAGTPATSTPAVVPTAGIAAVGSPTIGADAAAATPLVNPVTTIFPGAAGFTRPQLDETTPLTKDQQFFDMASGEADPRAGGAEASVTLQAGDIARVQAQRAERAQKESGLAAAKNNAPQNVAKIMAASGLGAPNILQTSQDQQTARVAQGSRVGKTNQQLAEMDRQAAGKTHLEQQNDAQRIKLAGLAAIGRGTGKSAGFENVQIPRYNAQGKQIGTESKVLNKDTGEYVAQPGGNQIQTPRIQELTDRIASNEAAKASGDDRKGFANWKSRDAELAKDKAELARLQGVTEAPPAGKAPAPQANATTIASAEKWLETNKNHPEYAKRKAYLDKLKAEA